MTDVSGLEPHMLTGEQIEDEDGKTIPQWIVEGGEVGRADLGGFSVIAMTLTLSDITDDSTGIAVLVLSSELALQLGRTLTNVGASTSPLTKQIERRQSAAANATSKEDN